MTVKRVQEMETDSLQVGDVIACNLPQGKNNLIVVKTDGDNALCIFEEIIEYCQMNKENTTEGGYEASYMRMRLQEIALVLPDRIREVAQPFKNGDMLRLPKKSELFDGEIEYFNNEKNRVATYKGKTDWYWLQDVVSAAHFADVADDGGLAYGAGALDTTVGCRPFALINLNLAAQGRGACAGGDNAEG